MADRNYSPEERLGHQRTIALAVAIAVAVVVVSGTLQSWSAGSFVAGVLAIFCLAAPFWWLFASRTARPLPTDRKFARWPYLSKKKMDEITKGR